MNVLATQALDLPVLIVIVLCSGVLSAFLLRRLLLQGPAPGGSFVLPDRVAFELAFIALVGMVLRGIAAPFVLRVIKERFDLDAVDRDLIVSLVLNGAIVLFAVLFARRHSRPMGFSLGLDGSRRESVPFELAFAALGLVAIAPLFVAVFQFNEVVLDRLGIEEHQEMVRELLVSKDKLHEVWIVLGIGVLIPFLEEVLFRGLVLRGLAQALRPLPAVIASAAFFAIMHDAPARLPVFVLGLLFGMLYLRTRSIFASFVAHALFNTAQLLYVIPRAP